MVVLLWWAAEEEAFVGWLFAEGWLCLVFDEVGKDLNQARGEGEAFYRNRDGLRRGTAHDSLHMTWLRMKPLAQRIVLKDG